MLREVGNKLLNSTLYRNCSLGKEELVALIAYELFAVEIGSNIFLITFFFCRKFFSCRVNGSETSLNILV
jgi:hypothetical protein